MTFPVPKKNPGEWRGVVNMRGQKHNDEKVQLPLPVIEYLLVKQGANHIFSILDLKQAFHQQPLKPHYTTCYNPLGLFQWRVTVMGLKNEPQQFEQMVGEVLEPVRDVAPADVDDILIGTKAEEGVDSLEHDRDVRRGSWRF